MAKLSAHGKEIWRATHVLKGYKYAYFDDETMLYNFGFGWKIHRHHVTPEKADTFLKQILEAGYQVTK